MKIKKITMPDFEIDIDIREGTNMMVNATQMGGMFGLDYHRFMEQQGTKDFIRVCLYGSNAGYLGVETREDFVRFESERDSKEPGAWWIHNILALKFVETASPGFAIALYVTINKVLREYDSGINHEKSPS